MEADKVAEFCNTFDKSMEPEAVYFGATLKGHSPFDPIHSPYKIFINHNKYMVVHVRWTPSSS